MERGALSEGEWGKSKLLVERSEMDIEMCELWRTSSECGENVQIMHYCNEQMTKLANTIEMGN